MKNKLIAEMKSIATFFANSTECLSEENSEFSPKEEIMTVAQQVAHAAQTIDWFFDGIQAPNGFDMNFEEHCKKIANYNSLSEAREWFSKAIHKGIEIIEHSSEEELSSPLPAGPIMGGQPKFEIVAAISDHTAHHRGALTVYSRILGKSPKMPYGEM